MRAIVASLFLATAAATAACDGQCSALLQVQTTQSILKKSVQQSASSRRIAIVTVLKNLDGCRVSRLRKLVASLDKRYDVWVLHGNETQNPSLTRTLRRIGVRIEPQATVPEHGGWRTFGSPLSGFAKAAFIKFMVAHSEYQYVWHLEDDVVFTGNWAKLLNHLQRAFPTQSLVSKVVYQNYNAQKWYLGGCKLGPGRSCATSHKEFLSMPGYDTKYDKNLSGPVHVHVDWMLARLSHEYAIKLARELETTSGAGGHHEGLAGPFCLSQARAKKKKKMERHAAWCEIGVLPRRLMGIFETGHWSNYGEQIAMLADAGSLVPWKLYHPFKCKDGGSHGPEA